MKTVINRNLLHLLTAGSKRGMLCVLQELQLTEIESQKVAAWSDGSHWEQAGASIKGSHGSSSPTTHRHLGHGGTWGPCPAQAPARCPCGGHRARTGTPKHLSFFCSLFQELGVLCSTHTQIVAQWLHCLKQQPAVNSSEISLM